MDEILAHLKAFRASGTVAAVGDHLREDLRAARGSSLQEPPAVRALFDRRKLAQRGRVVVIADFDDRYLARILDDEHILAAVIGVVLAGIHDHCDRVSFAHAHAVDREALCHFAVGTGREVLFPEDGVVPHQVNGNAVREGRIGILIPELRVLEIDVDLSGLRGDPLYIRGFALIARNDEVLLDLDAVAGVVFLAVLASLDVDREERIAVVAELIVPAVVALSVEIIESGGEIDPFAVVPGPHIVFVFSDESAQAVDREFIFAAVIGCIVEAVDHQSEVIALFNVLGIDIQALCHLCIDFGGKILLPAEMSVVIQRDSCAVRPRGVGVLVLHLRIGGVDRDRAVLGDPPFDDGRPVVCAGIDIVALDLQVAVVEIPVLAVVKRFRVIGVVGIVLVAPLEDPAVASLFSEVIFDIGKILPRFGSTDIDVGLIFRAADVDDRDIKGASVIGGVAFRVDHKVQAVRSVHV